MKHKLLLDKPALLHDFNFVVAILKQQISFASLKTHQNLFQKNLIQFEKFCF